jgi:hypothetical protein
MALRMLAQTTNKPSQDTRVNLEDRQTLLRLRLMQPKQQLPVRTGEMVFPLDCSLKQKTGPTPIAASSFPVGMSTSFIFPVYRLLH